MMHCHTSQVTPYKGSRGSRAHAGGTDRLDSWFIAESAYNISRRKVLGDTGILCPWLCAEAWLLSFCPNAKLVLKGVHSDFPLGFVVVYRVMEWRWKGGLRMRGASC